MRRANGRGGFTLVELLIVIAIIGVLMAILVPAVMSVLTRGPKLQAGDDISQLGIGMQSFYTKFGFYPPSKFTYNDAPAAGNPLSRMYPNAASYGGLFGGGTTLTGDQCLVFFLGGYQTASPPAVYGFSTNPADPNPKSANNIALGNTSTVGPFFEFQPTRLYSVTAGAPLSYRDAFKQQPYVYFSCNNTRNGYLPGDAVYGVGPATSSAGNYYNPTTYQIISAGLDMQFNTKDDQKNY